MAQFTVFYPLTTLKCICWKTPLNISLLVIEKNTDVLIWVIKKNPNQYNKFCKTLQSGDIPKVTEIGDRAKVKTKRIMVYSFLHL